jgi:hypothetical protein
MALKQHKGGAQTYLSQCANTIYDTPLEPRRTNGQRGYGKEARHKNEKERGIKPTY